MRNCSPWISAWRKRVDSAFYVKVLKRLRACMCLVRLNLTQDNGYTRQRSCTISSDCSDFLATIPITTLDPLWSCPLRLFPVPKMQNGNERTALGRFGSNKLRNNEAFKKINCWWLPRLLWPMKKKMRFFSEYFNWTTLI